MLLSFTMDYLTAMKAGLVQLLEIAMSTLVSVRFMQDRFNVVA
jgi:hypothetical protein